MIPPGVAVGRSRSDPCGDFHKPIINIDAVAMPTGTVVSVGAGGRCAMRRLAARSGCAVTGADVDICAVGIGVEYDGEGNVTSLPPTGTALTIDGDHAVVHRSYLNGQVVVTVNGSDAQIGDSMNGSGETNSGVRAATVLVSANAMTAAQRVIIRDPFPRALQGLVGSGVSGGDDVNNHANNWARTPTITSATSADNFATVLVQGQANPLARVDIYFDSTVTVTRQPAVMADASGYFSFTGALPNPNVLIMAGSTLDDATHSNRVGSSSQWSSAAHVTVGPPPVTVRLAPAALAFTQVEGGPLPVSQTLTVTASGLSWQVAVTPATGTEWLHVTPANGMGNGALTAAIQPNTLAPGEYHATINVSNSANSADHAAAAVTLIVKPRPLIQLAPTSLSFTQVVSGPLPISQTLVVTAPAVTWQAVVSPTVGAEWLGVAPAVGQGNGGIAVAVQPNALPPGAYSADIIVTDTAQIARPVTASVQLTVPPPPTIEVSPAAFTFTEVLNAPLPALQRLLVTAPTTTTWTISSTSLTPAVSAADWLTIVPASASGKRLATLELKPNALTPGSYAALVTVAEAAQPDNRATATVTLLVQGGAPPLQLPTTPLTFTETISQPLPISQTLNLVAPGIAWQSAITTTEGGAWLQVTPSSGVGDALLHVSILANTLAPGVYHATITLSATADASAHANTEVTLTVLSPAQFHDYLPLIRNAGKGTTTLPQASVASP
ncbi:MAG: hypothetical protein R2911_00900 [Caldilineaceae bacterium]